MDDKLFSALQKYIEENLEEDYVFCMPCYCMDAIPSDEIFGEAGETFSEMLFRFIKEKGISEVDCYKKAGLSRQLFSKIRSNKDYMPSRDTAIALSLSLQLSIDETDELLESAGFALSHSKKADLIVRYFITNENWKMMDINEALYTFGEAPLNC